MTDRHGVSDRCAASLGSAVLQDVGLMHDQDSSMVIDRSKILREREREKSSKVICLIQCPVGILMGAKTKHAHR